MCMFCVIQKWSRRVATMLPWLVIPLIGLWAISQLLPPAFRFEITSSRLACVFVLLVTLFWYEVLVPQLSAWWVRRNACLRERKRFEALELQKLKKMATRKCRNCLTPYWDQNPGGGKFMCSYCGHISKRPVLDLPIPPGIGISNSGIIKDLFGKGGKILNGKPLSDNVSIYDQEWLERGSWVVNGSFTVNSAYPPRKSGVGFFGGNEPCLRERSYSGAYYFGCKLLTSFLVSIRWLWRKLFRISSSKEVSLTDADHRGRLAKKGENGNESRGEKARRKAEEKRQFRLEKELLEEEERKQREEVARLVEERRRLRDEKVEAENRAKGACSLREKDSKKEAEKRRHERRKEKDKGSSKSNSDVEELEKKAKEKESLKTGLDSVKGHNIESGPGSKVNSANNFSKGHVGARYFDRMKGTFLSSSKAFTGSTFFGKVAPTPVPASKEIKPSTSVDYSLASNSRSDVHPPDCLPGKTIMNGDDKSNIRVVTLDTQRKTAPRSWQQLFTRSPVASAPAPSHPNVISRPCSKSQVEVQSSPPPCSVSSAQLYDNPINLPSPFILPSFSSRPANSSSLPAAKAPFFPIVADTPHDLLPEEPEIFEDPCYEPDPVLLLGPVSESLDNFQLGLGSSYISDELGRSFLSTSVCSLPEISRPSPIESPMSRQKVSDEKLNNPNHFPSSPKVTDMYSSPVGDMNNISDNGTWHMWNSSPLGPDGLSLVGGPASWIASLEQSRLNNEEIMHYSLQKTMASLFTQDGDFASGTLPQNVLIGNAQTCSPFDLSIPSSKYQDPWLQNTFFPPLAGGESHMHTSSTKEPPQKKMIYGSPSRCATNHAFDTSTANFWSKNEWAVQDSSECVRNPSVPKPPIGGLYATPDVQSLWSFE